MPFCPVSWRTASRHTASLLAVLTITAVFVPPLMVPLPVYAQDSVEDTTLPRVGVRVGIHDGFQRIVFDWPRRVRYSITQQGAELTIRFEEPASINLTPVLRTPLPYVKFTEQTPGTDHTLVKIVLDDGISGSAFQDAARVVVDLRRDAVETTDEAEAPQPEEASAPETPAETTPAEAPAPAAKNDLPDVSVPQMAASEGKPAAASTEIAAPAAVPEPAPATQSKTDLTDETIGADEAENRVAQDILKGRKRPKYTQPSIEVGAEPLQLLTLDPGVSAGAAIFRRAGFVYVVFDRKFSNPLDKMMKGFVPVKVEGVDVQGDGSVYRFYLPQDLNLRVMRDQTAWSIYALQKEPTAPISLSVAPQPTYALGARLVLNISKPGNTVRFYDPEVGDLLLALPLAQTGQAMRLGSQYADFHFVPAEQGMVLQPRIDGVDIKRMTQGVEITARNGLRLSPEADTGLTSTMAYEGDEETRLFDFKGWYGPPKLNYTAMRQRWETALAEVPVNERDRIRLDMARFNFARNHPQEAQGLLDLLASTVPDVVFRSEYLALRGAVHVLTRDAPAAIKDLSTPELASQPEAQLWLAMAYVRQRDWKKANELFMQSDTVLERYPEPHFTNFSLAAVEAGLGANNNVYAAKVLDRLVQRRPDIERTSEAAMFLRGTFLSQAGHLDRAEELWKRVARSDDPLYRVRAVMVLTDMDVVRGKIKPGEAAERLEKLRYVWRGDDLEIDLLRRLGKFYIESGKVADGLATLKQVLAFLPDNDDAKKLRDEMAFAFRDVFLGSRGEDLSPLDALSLYERFNDLAPAGEEGDAIVRNLAERMVAVDLLDRAAAILSDQVRRRLTGTFKARIGAQAAGIYLLDGKAEAGLKILADSEQPNLPEELVTERNLLKARAFADQGRKNDALAILDNIPGDNADRLRADIAWKSRDWVEAAKVLDRLIGPPPPHADQAMPDKLAPLVTNRAIALAMSNDIPGLDDLRLRYGNAMKKTQQNELFISLVEPESALPHDEKAMRAVSADVELFQEYLENYRRFK